MKKHIFLKGTNLVFVEMVIALLFFSVSSVIVLDVFSSASSKVEKIKLDEKINLAVQSLCEAYSAQMPLKEAIETVFGGIPAEFDENSGSVALSLTEECVYTGEDNGTVIIFLNETKEKGIAGELSLCGITAEYGDKSFTVQCSAYVSFY